MYAIKAFGKIKPLYAKGYTANLLLAISTFAFGYAGGVAMKVLDFHFSPDIEFDPIYFYRFSLMWWLLSLLLGFILASIIARNLTNQIGPGQKSMVSNTIGVNRA